MQNPCKMNLIEDQLAVLESSLNLWVIYEAWQETALLRLPVFFLIF